MKRKMLSRPRKNPSTQTLVSKYVRKWHDIVLLPNTIEVVDVYLDEETNKVMIKYVTDYGEERRDGLNFLGNYKRLPFDE